MVIRFTRRREGAEGYGFAQMRKGAKTSPCAEGGFNRLTISSNASDWMESGFAAKLSPLRPFGWLLAAAAQDELCAFARTFFLLRVSAPPREFFYGRAMA